MMFLHQILTSVPAVVVVVPTPVAMNRVPLPVAVDLDTHCGKMARRVQVTLPTMPWTSFYLLLCIETYTIEPHTIVLCVLYTLQARIYNIIKNKYSTNDVSFFTVRIHIYTYNHMQYHEESLFLYRHWWMCWSHEESLWAHLCEH